jgi:phosphotransferase system enzyme I (PtsI)
VARHVRRELAPGGARLIEVDAPVVVVARDLSPADTIRLARSPAIALVTEVGSASSHTALVARSFGLVTVVGVADAGRSVVDGDVVIVDGLAACVVVRPEPAEREAALDRGRRYSAFAESLARREVRANHTADGVRVFIHANLELPDEAPLAVEAGGEGVGLYRTEFLFLGATEPPDEATQLAAYRAVVEAVAPRPVTIRTYDLGGDKVARGGRRDRMREPNPALGLRALRFSLARRDLFITQLRAILRAAEHGRVRVMFPLVTTVGELDEARAALDEAREQLRAEGTAFGEVAFGAMVEVPSAVMLADRFARRVDFLSVGTNDLVQYTFAVDRQNPSVAALASPLDPAILQLLRRVSTDALAADVELSMCGDLAADPFGLPLVIGLGYRCLSVPCGALPLVRAVVARIETDRARLVADEAVRAETPEEVAVLVRDAFGEALGELWTEVGIEQPASR